MNKSYNCKITLATKKLEKQFISGDNFPGEEAIFLETIFRMGFFRSPIAFVL